MGDVTKELARFLVVRSCGFLEQVSIECCKMYLSAKSDPRSSSFGVSWLDRSVNPTPGRLIELMRRFDDVWADELSDLLNENDEYLKREFEFLVDRRNRIAHGLSEGITIRKAIVLYDAVQEISEWFVAQFKPVML
ncbi:MAG: hypothetical protein KTV68_16555 [Acidimicrobiia bacterium]|nr:hypothetical protein [Acidimicrobiia bacterium]